MIEKGRRRDPRAPGAFVATGLPLALLAAPAGSALVARHPQPSSAALLLVVMWLPTRVGFFGFPAAIQWRLPGVSRRRRHGRC